MTLQSAAKHNIPVSVCGEMASDPYASLLLIGMGVNELSVVSTAYLQIKRLVRLINYENAGEVAAQILQMSTINEVKTYLEECFKENIGEQL